MAVVYDDTNQYSMPLYGLGRHGGGGRWAILDVVGNVIATVHGHPGRLATGYSARALAKTEKFTTIPRYRAPRVAHKLKPALPGAAMNDLF